MPMSSAAPTQSVEEILASIRQAINEDETRRGRPVKPVSSAQPSGRAQPPAVRSLTSANDDDDEWASTEPDYATQNVIDLAIEKAIDGVSAALGNPERSGSAAGVDRQPRLGAPSAGRDERRAESRPAGPAAPQRPLLSARSGASVAASFEDLARNIATLTPAQIREMAQEMLRPMLKSWLDDNLPNLVERLVRDEIERVSRGR
jgi:cell pole-organizing protein PopZ